MSEPVFSIFPNEPYVDLTLYQYGREACSPSHLFGPAVRNHYLFHYILSGKGVLHAAGSQGDVLTFPLRAGDGFLIFPFQVTTYIADADDPWEYAWLEFDGLRSEEYMTRYGFSLDRPIFIPKDVDSGNSVRQELLAITASPNGSAAYLIGHLYLFMDALLKASPSPAFKKNGRLRDFYIREALSFIEQNYQKDITPGDIAAQCKLEKNYFGKIFKDAMSMSPQDFLITYRTSRAADLLKTTSLPIEEIAARVGYVNRVAFTRVFKLKYGVTPRAFRSGMLQKKEEE